MEEGGGGREKEEVEGHPLSPNSGPSSYERPSYAACRMTIRNYLGERGSRELVSCSSEDKTMHLDQIPASPLAQRTCTTPLR